MPGSSPTDTTESSEVESAPRFETARLWLTPTAEDDAPFLLELMNSPGWLAFIGDRNIRSLADAEAYVRERVRPTFERYGFGKFTLCRKSDGRAIGSCGLYDRPGVDGIDIGFALLPEYAAQGYAFEASRQLLSLAFEHFGLDRVTAITTRDNIHSQRLLSKLGMVRERDMVLPEDPGTPLWLYAIEREQSTDRPSA